MAISASAAYGILLVTALLVLIGGVVVFKRLGGEPNLAGRARPPMRVSWPISAEPSAHAPLGRSRASRGRPGPENRRGEVDD